jgi:hypothetical protein
MLFSLKKRRLGCIRLHWRRGRRANQCKRIFGPLSATRLQFGENVFERPTDADRDGGGDDVDRRLSPRRIGSVSP